MFQKLCLQKPLWDDPLPEDKAKRWVLWFKEIQESNSSFIPRCVLEGIQGEIIETIIHGLGMQASLLIVLQYSLYMRQHSVNF